MKRIVIFLFFGVTFLPVIAQRNLSSDYQHNAIELPLGDTVVTFHTTKPGKNFEPGLNKRYYWFDKGAVRSTQGSFKGNLLDGPYVAQGLKKKELLEKGIYEKGLRTGLWLTWYSNGIIESKITYENGLKSGIFFRYDDQGRIAQQGTYKKDKLHAKLRNYRNGEMISVDKFRNGELKKEKNGKIRIGKVPKVKRDTTQVKASHKKEKKETQKKSAVDSVRTENSSARPSIRQPVTDSASQSTQNLQSDRADTVVVPARRGWFLKKDEQQRKP